MKAIIKHLRIITNDLAENGIFIAFVNAMWFVRHLLPQKFFDAMMRKKHIRVERQIQKVVGDITKISLPQPNKMYDFKQSPIWFCWLQGEKSMPAIVQMCLKSIKVNSNGHPIVFVNLDNYKQYITIPKHIENLFQSKKIRYAHFADIIRTSLLYNYGGCWIDSTIFLTQKLPSEIFNSEFFSVKLHIDTFFVSQARWSNFFLATHSGNELMGFTLKMFDIYLSKKDCFIDYFMMDYFMDMVIAANVHYKSMIDTIPYNNGNVHSLKFHLGDEYSAKHLADICGDTYIHKLSWKMDSQDYAHNTIFKYISHLYL